jgi:hypothetical protein
MTEQRRILFCHPKSWDDAQIEEGVRRLREVAARVLPGYEVEITSGRDAYNQHFARCGGWGGWTYAMATETRYQDGQPLFHTYAVPDLAMGRATAELIGAALKIGKRVVSLRPWGLQPVFGVQKVSDDMATGYEAQTPE